MERGLTQLDRSRGESTSSAHMERREDAPRAILVVSRPSMPPRRVVLLAAGGHEAAPSRPLKDQASSALPGLPGRRTLIITAKALIAFPLGHWRAPRRHGVQSTLDLSALASGHQRARVRRVCVQACGVRVRVHVLAHHSGGLPGFRPRQPASAGRTRNAGRSQIARQRAAQRRSGQNARRSHAPIMARRSGAAGTQNTRRSHAPPCGAAQRRSGLPHAGRTPRGGAAA